MQIPHIRSTRRRKHTTRIDTMQPDQSENTPLITRRRMLALTGGALGFSQLPSLLAQEPAKPAQAAVVPKKDPYADAVLVDGEPPMPQEGSFCFAVLPDTQNYSEKFPDTYVAQTKWLVEQKEKRRIAGVFHLGDITNNNAPAEWQNAQRAMKVLEDGGLPYCLIPGNHDYSAKGVCSDRTTLLNDYFPVAGLKKMAHWGGNYDKEPERLEKQLPTAGGQRAKVPRAGAGIWAARGCDPLGERSGGQTPRS